MFFIDFVLRFVSENPISIIGIILGILYIIFSLRRIGPTEIGLVTKRFSLAKLKKDNENRTPRRAYSDRTGSQA